MLGCSGIRIVLPDRTTHEYPIEASEDNFVSFLLKLKTGFLRID